MTTATAPSPSPLPPIRSGGFLLAAGIKKRGHSQAEAARLLHVTPPCLAGYLKGKYAPKGTRRDIARDEYEVDPAAWDTEKEREERIALAAPRPRKRRAAKPKPKPEPSRPRAKAPLPLAS